MPTPSRKSTAQNTARHPSREGRQAGQAGARAQGAEPFGGGASGRGEAKEAAASNSFATGSRCRNPTLT